MQFTALLVGLMTITACSFDRIVVAELDLESAAGSTMADTVGGTGGTAPAPSSGSGGVVAAGGSPSRAEAGTFSIISGGSGGSTILVGASTSEGGASSETRCSCLGRETEVCGTDGFTYPTDCSNPETCMPPGIACLQACPCPDPSGEGAEVDVSTWFPLDCVSAERCSDGVICMTFTDRALDDTQTTCATSR